MPKTTKPDVGSLHGAVLRTSRLHFLYFVALAVQVVLYHVWNLITLQAIMQRWVAAVFLLAVSVIVWFVARSKPMTNSGYRNLLYLLILTDIAVATFGVYTQRGMASRAVMLFAIPIVVSSVLLSRAALFATAALCMAAYIGASVSYFALNFNEGYKIELYGEVGFYCVIFFILAALLWVVVRAKQKR